MANKIQFQTNEEPSQARRVQFHIIGVEDLASTKSHANGKRLSNAYVGMRVKTEGRKVKQPHYYTTSVVKSKSLESEILWYDNLGPMMLPSTSTITFELCSRSSIPRTSHLFAKTAPNHLDTLINMQGDLADRECKISIPLLTETGCPMKATLMLNIRELASARSARAEVELAELQRNARSSIEKEPLEPEDDLTLPKSP